MNQTSHIEGKLPPQATDVEEIVLGAIMIERDAIIEVADKLSPQMFYNEANGLIFEAFLTLFNAGDPIDIVTTSDCLRKKGSLEKVGGAFRIASLTQNISSSANIEYHSAILAQKYLQRETIKSCNEAVKACYNDTEDIFDIISKIDLKKDQLLNEIIVKKETSNEGLLRDNLAYLEQNQRNISGITGVPSGFFDLDRITGGWQNTDLIIVAARPAMGKTSFVIQNAINAARDHGKAVAFFSLEMSNRQLMNKQISINTGIPLERFRKGELTEYDFQKIHSKVNDISSSRIFWDDTASIPITELRAKAKKLKRKENIDLLIVDYLQLIVTAGKSKITFREQEIAFISRSLKALAKELEIPVIALSQLSRSNENRADKRPMLSDLRESGSIEQDADMVLFIHRPEYYGIKEYENGTSTAGVAEIIISKHRNGETTDLGLNFIGSTTSFQDFEYRPHDLHALQQSNPPRLKLKNSFLDLDNNYTDDEKKVF